MSLQRGDNRSARGSDWGEMRSASSLSERIDTRMEEFDFDSSPGIDPIRELDLAHPPGRSHLSSLGQGQNALLRWRAGRGTRAAVTRQRTLPWMGCRLNKRLVHSECRM